MLTMIMMTAGQRHLVVNTNMWMKEITQLLSVLLLIMMIMVMMMMIIDVNNDNDDCRSETLGGEHQHVDEGDHSAFISIVVDNDDNGNDDDDNRC